MEFGQLIDHNMRNIFIEKLYTICNGESFPDPILKNQNLVYIWINTLKDYYSLLEGYRSRWESDFKCNQLISRLGQEE